MADNARKWREAGNKSIRSDSQIEEHRQRERERYHTDPEIKARRKAAAAKRRVEKPEEVRVAYALWRDKNIDKVRLYARDYARVLRSTGAGKAKAKEIRERRRPARQATQAAYYARRYGEHGELDSAFLYRLHRWQDHCCGYCNRPLEGKETIEHIVPLKRGGSNLPHNVILVCGACNTSKSDRLLDIWKPEKILPVPRFHSLDASKIAFQLLSRDGVSVSLEESGIRLPNGKNLIVLSSFWLSERFGSSPFSQAVIANMAPDSLLTFDFEWWQKPDVMVNIVTAKAGCALSIGARELLIDEPSTGIARRFMDRWHLQGFSSGSFYVGLRTPEGEWRAICSVTAAAGNRMYHLGRMAFRGHVAGGFSRLTKAIVRRMNAGGILTTYADKRFGDGAGYLNSGFIAQGFTVPSFHYINATGLYHWNAYTKKAMERKLDFFETERPAWELARINGLWRVDDLPLQRFVLRS